jgi:hypothetical protein
VIRWLATAAGCLPAIFWMFYSLWNLVLSSPPALGRLTAINILYLLMLPATLVMVLRWRQTRMTGQPAYLAFLAWITLGILWHNPAPGGDVIKALFICALAAPIAAQMLIGGRRAQIVFAASVTLTAFAVSVWMVWQALASGFVYRTGTLLNQNFVASMVAPGLLIATAFYLHREDGPLRRMLLGLVLTCSYASLLLGSRGVLIAEIAGVAALVVVLRPSLRRTRGLIAGTAVIIVMAQMPMIPNALWQRGYVAVAALRASMSRATQPAAPASQAGGAGSAAAPAATPGSIPEPTVVARPLDPRAAQSTALGRFVEKDTDTLDKRTSLWRATIVYIVSQPSILLFGGGLGISGDVAWQANPVFHNAHNTYLQILAETGLVGAGLLVWLFWSLMRRLAVMRDAFAHAWLAALVCWLVAGLTSTVIDLHVFWVTVGVAAATTVIATAPDRHTLTRDVTS